MSRKRKRRKQAASRSRPGTELLLNDIVGNQRALRAFQQLGLKTAADFLATPRDDVLAIRGIGNATYEQVYSRVTALVDATPSPPVELVPERIREIELQNLPLEPPLLAALIGRGIRTVGGALALGADAMSADSAIGDAGVADFRQCLDAALDRELRRPDSAPVDDGFPTLLADLTSTLDAADRELLVRRVGIGRRHESRLQLALAWGQRETEIAERERQLCARLREKGSERLERVQAEMRRELVAFEGLVTGDRLAPGTLLRATADANGDRELPLRLVAFCWPDQFQMIGHVLCDLTKKQLATLLELLDRRIRPERLPLPLQELDREIRKIVTPVPRELVQHLVRDQLRAVIRIEEGLGEVIDHGSASVSTRLEAILDEIGRPTLLDDLLFHYRDRYRRARKSRLLEQMRKDRRFLEIGTELWGLREWHLDELELARTEAERITDRLCATKTRHDVDEVADGAPLSERARYILIDCLRRDPHLRDLGRGEFAPRHSWASAKVEELVKSLRRAMGELPFSRFLQNQPEHQRRLVSSLLLENRLFVSPSNDRIDLLENYPFNFERMRRLLHSVDDCLEVQGGYSTLDTVREAVLEAELGGGWLTDHLLRDLLRRNGHYEFLPGGLIARASLGLIGWIQQRTREALRAIGQPSTPDEVVGEDPELAEFHCCVPALMERDPLLQSADGLHFQIV